MALLRVKKNVGGSSDHRRCVSFNQQSLRCQYSGGGQVSSEKHETAAEAGVEEGKGEGGSVLTATAVGGHRPRLEPAKVLSHAAKVATTLRSRKPERLYIHDTILERLASDLEPVAAAR